MNIPPHLPDLAQIFFDLDKPLRPDQAAETGESTGGTQQADASRQSHPAPQTRRSHPLQKLGHKRKADETSEQLALNGTSYTRTFLNPFTAVLNPSHGKRSRVLEHSMHKEQARLMSELRGNTADLRSPEEEAKRELEKLQFQLLEGSPDELKSLQEMTGSHYATYTNNGDSLTLNNAIEDYTSESGDFILMNAALRHEALAEFISEVHGVPSVSEAEVEEYCDVFIARYPEAYEDFETQDLIGRYKEVIVPGTEALRAYVSSAPPLSGQWVAKGLKLAPTASGDNAYVNAKLYVSAFLEKRPIQYNSFLSTSASWSEADDFTGNNCASEDMVPLLAIDLTGSRDDARLQLINNKLAQNEPEDIILILRWDKARGVAVGQGSEIAKEQEILLAPDHIVFPEKLIYCEGDQYVLVGRVTYPDSLLTTDTSDPMANSAGPGNQV